MVESNKLMRVEDLMEHMHIGRNRAYALMRAKAFPSMKIGSTYYITEKNYSRWLEDYTGKKFTLE